jgi:DNA-binding NarL/FixJ family response regulator
LGELITIWSLAITEELRDRTDEAAALYRQFLDMWSRIEDYHEAIPGLCSAATFFAHQNSDSDLSVCANALSAIATASGNPEALAGLAFALGERALLDGDPREAAKLFRQAAAQFEPLEVPVEWSRAEWRAGVALAASNDRDEAVARLRDAYRTLRKLGARSLSSRVARDLAALGEPVEERRGRSNENDGEATLTKRQRDVARLLADGLTNKEIAQKLFVSPRTVDMHVAHILDRLDCRSRTEAASKLAGPGTQSTSN